MLFFSGFCSMSICTSNDVSILNTNSTALQTCIEEFQGTNIFPSGSNVLTCMGNINMSSDCASCWGTLFGDFKTCFIDTCDFTADTPVNTELPQGCADCLIEFGSKHSTTDDVCGIAIADLPEGSAETINSEIQRWSGATGKSSTPSVRSIGTSVLVFALFMMAI
jgi:hypothetical protein